MCMVGIRSGQNSYLRNILPDKVLYYLTDGVQNLAAIYVCDLIKHPLQADVSAYALSFFSRTSI